MEKGYFITFEGMEGCGKSTQSRLLAEAFEKAGYNVTLDRSPGSTPIAEKLRKILKEPTPGEKIAPETELLLFGACHSQMVRERILPVLEKGGVFLSDRFCDSTLAYQGFARGLGADAVKWINSYACGNCHPDLTILLDLPPEKGIERAVVRSGKENGNIAEDRFDSETISFHKKVREAFLAMAEEEKERFIVVDAAMCIEGIQKKIREEVHVRLGVF